MAKTDTVNLDVKCILWDVVLSACVAKADLMTAWHIERFDPSLLTAQTRASLKATAITEL